MSKTIIDLIDYAGIDDVTVQFIDTSIVKANDKKRTKDCELTFATGEVSANDIANESGRFGVVVWVDRNKAAEFLSD